MLYCLSYTHLVTVHVILSYTHLVTVHVILSAQEKRSEYIKVSSAIEDNAQVQEKERKVFRPPNTQPASVLAANGKPFSQSATHYVCVCVCRG